MLGVSSPMGVNVVGLIDGIHVVAEWIKELAPEPVAPAVYLVATAALWILTICLAWKVMPPLLRAGLAAHVAINWVLTQSLQTIRRGARRLLLKAGRWLR